MNYCLENCILDTSLPSLGREIKPQEEGGDKIRALVSRQPVYWFVLGNCVPHPPAQPPDVKRTVLHGRRLPLRLPLGRTCARLPLTNGVRDMMGRTAFPFPAQPLPLLLKVISS